MNKENLFSLIIIGLFLLFLGQYNKVYAYEYYSYSKELLKNENIYKMPPITVTPGYAQEWDMPKFSSPQNSNMQNRNYNSSSGSTYFIYSPNQNPSYCIPGSTYAICH